MIDLGEYFNYAVPMTGEQMIKYQTNLTAVSLFAGVGGFDLALERNGVKVVASAEIDKHARSVLARHFPNATQYDDVRKVTADGLRTAGFIPERGIITGGFPCQDLSVAGKRAGLAGVRSGLFYEIARIADETRAKWLVLENVPGLLSSQRGADMGAVVGTLVDLGYGVAWRVLDAQHFGVPQRRRRVFIVAERSGDPARCAQVLFERQGVRGDSSQGRAPRQETTRGAGQGAEIAGTITDTGFRCDLNKAQLPAELYHHGTVTNQDTNSGHLVLSTEPTLYEPHHGDGRATEGVANTLAARMGTGGNNTPVLVEPEVFVKAKRAQSDQDDETWKTDAPHPTLNQFDQGDSRTVAVSVEPIAIQGSVVGRNDKAGPGGKGHGEVGDSMFTLNTTDRHGIATSTVRRLTPTECERLQGFPDGWTEGQADSHRYKQMGNAVAVPVVEWVIQGIMEVMNNE
jgi:DNA (cytosine-5)-methyltransferase 1